MHHPAHTPTGPADLALPLALLVTLSTRDEPAGRGTSGADRAPEVRAAAARKRRAARRRAAAVQG
ncbi:hypothetical protein ACFU98_23450 [Streptomyces sp. NPDC057575]|uniref:hypothetical protein n=1 Tax=unclassified Streptomyces TaxID=2593676 RepID=UPI003683334A